MKKQRSASPSQAIPRSAPVSSTRSMISLRFSGSSGLGSWSGKLPSGRPVGLDQLQLQALQQRADHRPGHAVAAVDDDLQRPGRGAHDVGVDELQRRRLKLRVEVDLLERAARDVLAGWRLPVGGGLQFCLDRAADVLDAGVARQREGPLAQELRARVAGWIVRGGAHQSAVQLARADEVVEHLATDLPGIDHIDTGSQQALAIASRQLRGGQAHVVAERRLAAATPACRRARRARARRRGRCLRRRRRRSARRTGRGCHTP